MIAYRNLIFRAAGRGPAGSDRSAAEALVVAAFSCFEAAVSAWAVGDGTPPLPEVLARAMEAVNPVR